VLSHGVQHASSAHLVNLVKRKADSPQGFVENFSAPLIARQGVPLHSVVCWIGRVGCGFGQDDQ